MSFADTLKKSLTPELYAQVTDQLGDDFDYDLVPRTRLNKVIGQRNSLRDQINGVSTEPAPAPAPTVEAEPAVDLEALKAEWKAQQDDAVNAVRIQYAVMEQLRKANAIDPELLWSSNVIDKSKLKLDEAGHLVGFDDVMADLKKNKPQQFGATVPTGTGKNGGEDTFSKVTSKDTFLQLPYDQQIAFKQSHPELFNSFTKN